MTKWHPEISDVSNWSFDKWYQDHWQTIKTELQFYLKKKKFCLKHKINFRQIKGWSVENETMNVIEEK